MATENLDNIQPEPAADDFASEIGCAPAAGAGPPSGVVSGSPGRSFASARRRLTMPNLVLAAMFLGGTGCLYLLSLRTGPRTASAEEQTAEAKVDAALSQITALPKAEEIQRETSAIVDTFYYEARQRQVPLEALNGNLFVYVAPAGAAPRMPGDEEDTAGPVVPQPRGAADALAAARELKLQSVLRGTHGATAMISNNLLSEGQVINGWTVHKIEPRQVTLTWNDQQYVLRMPR